MTSRVVLYLSLIGLEALLVWGAAAGSRAGGRSISDVIGGRWPTFASVLRDVGIGVGMWVVFRYGIAALPLLPSRASAVDVQRLLPQGWFESALWIVVSCSAGFAEEFAFRGYLQRRFARWGPALAVLAQAVVFGAFHFYQGLAAVVRITIYGALFGAVAKWRRSLRPGMIGHAWSDIAAGLLRI